MKYRPHLAVLRMEHSDLYQIIAVINTMCVIVILAITRLVAGLTEFAVQPKIYLGLAALVTIASMACIVFHLLFMDLRSPRKWWFLAMGTAVPIARGHKQCASELLAEHFDPHVFHVVFTKRLVVFLRSSDAIHYRLMAA